MLKIIDGDIFESNADIIAHQVNCQGVMGGGIALQVKRKYPNVFKEYNKYCNRYKGVSFNLLGNIYTVGIQSQYPDLPRRRYICNLFGQDEFGGNRCHTDYDALRLCLKKLNIIAIGNTVAIPYMMSCALAGGDWDIVSKMIEETLTDCDITLYRYSV